MTKLIIVSRSGEEAAIEASDSHTLMEAIREHDANALMAICGGCCSCATCHVYVDPAFVDRLPPMSNDEDGLLDGSNHRKPTSRLSCQVRVTKDLAGLKVTIAPED